MTATPDFPLPAAIPATWAVERDHSGLPVMRPIRADGSRMGYMIAVDAGQPCPDYIPADLWAQAQEFWQENF